jgi:hypothetical protein
MVTVSDELEWDEELQDELNGLTEDDLDVDYESDDVTNDTQQVEEDVLAQSFSQYFTYIKNFNQRAENEMTSTEATSAVDTVSFNTDSLLKSKLLVELDSSYHSNVMQVHMRVLKELDDMEKEDEVAALKKASEVNDDGKVVAVIQPTIIEEIQSIEEKAQQELEELFRRQEKEKENTRVLEEKRQKEQEEYEDLLQKKREEKKKELAYMQSKFLNQQKLIQEHLEQELSMEDNRLKDVEKQMHEKLLEIDENAREERIRFNNLKSESTKRYNDRRCKAVTMIQKNYKGYKVRNLYKPKLEEMQTSRKANELKRLEEE